MAFPANTASSAWRRLRSTAQNTLDRLPIFGMGVGKPIEAMDALLAATRRHPQYDLRHKERHALPGFGDHSAQSLDVSPYHYCHVTSGTAIRRRFGIRLIWRGNQRLVNEALACLRRKKVVCLASGW